MAARSSCLLLALAACSDVFGLETEPARCFPSTFDPLAGADIAPLELASVDRDERFALARDTSGEIQELSLTTGDVTKRSIDFGLYTQKSLALVPEGDAVFFTAAIEPPLLQGAVREDDTWRLVNDRLPAGTDAGTPTARDFGPRRVLVRLHEALPEVQEFEEVAGRWEPVGDVILLPGNAGPNLTPNGLTAVYLGKELLTHEGGGEGLVEGVFLIGRDRLDAPFGPRTPILIGSYNSPQLLGQCRHLYAVDASSYTFRRYDR